MVNETWFYFCILFMQYLILIFLSWYLGNQYQILFLAFLLCFLVLMMAIEIFQASLKFFFD